MKKGKRDLYIDLAFGLLYVVCGAAVWLLGGFNNPNDNLAIGAFVVSLAAGTINLLCDFLKERYRPTIRTIGLYVLAIYFLIGL